MAHSPEEPNLPMPRKKSHNSNALKSRDDLDAGDLIIYPFLWHWQHEAGSQRAEKMRPCVVLMKINADDPTAIILPITTRPASLRHDRIAVPPEECERVGMNFDRQASIGLNDFNFDSIKDSTCLRRNVPVRSFSADFMKLVSQEFRRVFDQRRAKSVERVPDPENEYNF